MITTIIGCMPTPRQAIERRGIWLLTLGLAASWAWGDEAVANRKLNRALAGGKGDIRGASRRVDHPFAISPDSRRVVYLADQERDEVVELYSVPLDGTDPDAAAVKLNGPLSEGGNVSGADPLVHQPFQISPDSQRVVYLADQERDEVVELWSVPIAGGKAVKLNPALVDGGDVRGVDAASTPFAISPDSRRVVYLADQERDEVVELWSVPSEGGPAVKLNPPLVAGGDVAGGGVATPFCISPDSQRVVYLADQDHDEVVELWSVPINGGKGTQLNRLLAGGRGDIRGDVPTPFRISPDSRRVVYLADQDQDEVVELWSVPIAGGVGVKLNATLVAGGDVGGEEAIDPFLISPDSQRVVYLADQEHDEVYELWSVAIAGGAVVKLNPVLADGDGDVRGVAPEMANPFRISPDSQRVVYLADQEHDEVYGLWSVAITGGPASALSPSLGARGDVRGGAAEMANPFRISPDSRRVVYIADQETDSVFELWSVAIDGGPVKKLNPVLAKGRGEIRGANNAVANPFLISPDSRRVLYLADQETVGVMELWSVAIDGGPVIKLNPPLAGGQGAIVGADYEVNNPFLISPDGRYAVYVADQDRDEVVELYESALPVLSGQASTDQKAAPEGSR